MARQFKPADPLLTAHVEWRRIDWNKAHVLIDVNLGINADDAKAVKRVGFADYYPSALACAWDDLCLLAARLHYDLSDGICQQRQDHECMGDELECEIQLYNVTAAMSWGEHDRPRVRLYVPTEERDTWMAYIADGWSEIVRDGKQLHRVAQAETLKLIEAEGAAKAATS